MSEILLTGAGRGASGGSASALPGTAANDAAVGSVAWVNPSNALVDDVSDAEVTLTLAQQSNYLKLTNFGFSIPGSASVVGIKVVLDSVNSTVASGFISTILRLVVGGVVSGDDKGASVDWQSLDEIGGAADAWGLSLTGADVNASNFGIVLSTTGNVGRGSAVARVDYVSITVFYV